METVYNLTIPLCCRNASFLLEREGFFHRLDGYDAIHTIRKARTNCRSRTQDVNDDASLKFILVQIKLAG
jgi:hypothetical protein